MGRTLVNGAITDHTLHIVGAITYITYRCVPHINGTMTERSVQSHIYHISYVIHIISHSGLIKVLERRNDVPSRARALRAEQGLFKQIWRAIESQREPDRARGSQSARDRARESQRETERAREGKREPERAGQ